jgi:DNA-binding transcriptional ArsR family regulator
MSRLDQTFKALADPTRRAILARLAKGDAVVGELASPFAMTWPAVTKHLKVLEGAGLIKQVREGNSRRCQLVAKPMCEARDWIDHYEAFWSDRLDALSKYLAVEHKRK